MGKQRKFLTRFALVEWNIQQKQSHIGCVLLWHIRSLPHCRNRGRRIGEWIKIKRKVLIDDCGTAGARQPSSAASQFDSAIKPLLWIVNNVAAAHVGIVRNKSEAIAFPCVDKWKMGSVCCAVRAPKKYPHRCFTIQWQCCRSMGNCRWKETSCCSIFVARRKERTTTRIEKSCVRGGVPADVTPVSRCSMIFPTRNLAFIRNADELMIRD